MKRRLASILLCAVMTISMVVPAFAVELIEESDAGIIEEEEAYILEDCYIEEIDNGVLSDDVIAEDTEAPYSGNCGAEPGAANAQYSFDEATKTMTITGTGDMYIYSGWYSAPWKTAYNDDIEKVVIGSGITSISQHAFSECKNLREVVISDTVEMIGPCAFENCTSLVGITFPDGLKSIQAAAFRGCSSLTSLYIPSSVTNIENSVVAYCGNLESINIDAGNVKYYSGTDGNVIVLKIDAARRLIAGCKNSIIPEDVTFIEDFSFAGHKDLRSINIPASVVNMGDNIFVGCDSLESITVSEDNEDFDSRINCNAIIKTSNNKLRFGCAKTIIPPTVAAIDKGAFKELGNLTSITIPATVTEIGDNVFDGSNNLASIFVEAGSAAYEKYKNDEVIKDKLKIIQYTVTFNTNGGSAITSVGVGYGKLTKPANPVKTGYTFAGWYKDKECTSEWNFATDIVSENVTLYAKWVAGKYTNTLKYDANGGNSAPSSQSEEVIFPNTKSVFTVSADKPVAYIKKGYTITFDGWYTEKTGGSKVGSTIEVGKDNAGDNQTVTIYAHWKEARKPYFKSSRATVLSGDKIKSVFVNTTGRKVVYTSSNTKVAKVDKNKGTITAVAAGKAVITAKIGKDQYRFNVTVKKPVISGNAEVKKGKTTTLTIKNATSKVKWSSSNTKIATIDNKGKVKGKKKGKVTITATYNGKKYKKTIKVK